MINIEIVSWDNIIYMIKIPFTIDDQILGIQIALILFFLSIKSPLLVEYIDNSNKIYHLNQIEN